MVNVLHGGSVPNLILMWSNCSMRFIKYKIPENKTSSHAQTVLEKLVTSIGPDIATTCQHRRRFQTRFPLPLRQTLHQDCRQSYYHLQTCPAEVNRLNACYKFCPLVDSESPCFPMFLLMVTMQGHVATVQRFISPPSCGRLATISVWRSWGWRHLVHRGWVYGNCRN